MRLVAKFVAIAVVTALVVSFLLVLINWSEGPAHYLAQGPGWFVRSVAFGGLVSLPFVIIGGVVFGIPAHVFLKRSESSLPLYLLTGTLVGLLSATIILGLFLGTFVVAWLTSLLGAGAGFVAALLWWAWEIKPRMSEMQDG